MRRILLLAALAVGFAAQGQDSTNRVGYANMAYIMSQLPEMKQMETELKSTQTQLRNQIQVKSKELQAQYDDFNANAAQMVDSVRARKEQELEKAIAGLEQMQQDAEVTLQNKQKLFMAPLYLKVNRAIAEVAAEHGYAIILTQQVSNMPVLLYQRKETDVSSLVLQKFGVAPEPK